MNSAWPPLKYNDWKETYQTLHRWLQIVGKLKLFLNPWTNHSWHTTFYITSRGFTTASMPWQDGNITVDFDFLDHKVLFKDSRGREHDLILRNESVAIFYARFRSALKVFDIPVVFDPHPNECADYIAFDQDDVHRTYNKAHAHNCFMALVKINNVFQIFRSKYEGKCSPVQLFWGSFDLAVTRFSGRIAPEHPGLAPHISPEIMKEAYSHEVISCGFWPGNEMYPHAAFYSYAYPEPKNLSGAIIKPDKAFYSNEIKEFLLPYEEVRRAPNPEELILDFIQSTYEAAANLGDWPRSELEVGPFLEHLQMKYADRLNGDQEKTPNH